ncbi:MAG TPA: DNRLRE domain-containing protein [Sphingomicrobium sp.]|nr:DNRLRE domain-containing protein [Sphingomicrobium sp.]
MSIIVSFQQGAGYQATIDTSLYQDSPDLHLGDGTMVAVDKGTGITRQGLLAFGEIFGSNSGQIPYGAVISSATLTLYTTNGSAAGGSLYRMTTGWSETSTWNSLGGGVQIGTETVGSADFVTGSVGTGARSFDVTASVNAWLSGAADANAANLANLGWLFSAGSTDGWNFGSSESGTAPKLTVTYSLGTPSTPELALSGNVLASEGTGTGPTDFTFTVNRTGDLSKEVSVAYTVAGTGTAHATFADFAEGAMPAGTVNFAAGESSRTLTIKVVGDSSVEGNETFELRLSDATNGAVIRSATATGTIENDDAGGGVRGVKVIAGSSLGVPDSSGSDRFGSPDPTGLAYNSATGRYFVVDAEIDESPFFGSLNLLEMNGQGGRHGGSAMTTFTNEPTGVAAWVGPDGSQRLFVTDDNNQRVYQIDPANPGVVLSSFLTTSFGCVDPEDISINPQNGNLFILSENDRRIYEVTQTGKLISTVQLPTTFVPISDPNAQDSGAEGLAYDAARDVFYVGGGFSTDIFVVSRAGLVIDTIDVLKDYPNANGLRVYPKGLTLGPSSDGSGFLSLWVADYGLDQVADGRLIEIMLNQSASTVVPPMGSLTGTTGSDTLSTSGDQRWTVDGLAGNDVITTLGGNDVIIGGSGNDRISAGAGDDLIRFVGTGHGLDSVDGGAGVDRIEAGAKDTVIGLTSLTGVEVITANGFASVTISGSSAGDVLNFSDVILHGISSIKGGGGNDQIHGSSKKDVIVGGTGADSLYGNGGADVFDFNSVAESSSAAPDWIFDFRPGSDKLDLKSIDPISTTTGDQAFSFIGEAAFTNKAGELRYDKSDPSRTTVLADTNGDGVADLSIVLAGSMDLRASDFYL